MQSIEIDAYMYTGYTPTNHIQINAEQKYFCKRGLY